MIKAAEIDLTQFMESCVSYSYLTYCMYISKTLFTWSGGPRSSAQDEISRIRKWKLNVNT